MEKHIPSPSVSWMPLALRPSNSCPGGHLHIEGLANKFGHGIGTPTSARWQGKGLTAATCLSSWRPSTFWILLQDAASQFTPSRPAARAQIALPRASQSAQIFPCLCSKLTEARNINAAAMLLARLRSATSSKTPPPSPLPSLGSTGCSKARKEAEGKSDIQSHQLPFSIGSKSPNQTRRSPVGDLPRLLPIPW